MSFLLNVITGFLYILVISIPFIIGFTLCIYHPYIMLTFFGIGILHEIGYNIYA